jgi:hypothetical protein
VASESAPPSAAFATTTTSSPVKQAQKAVGEDGDALYYVYVQFDFKGISSIKVKVW